MRKYQLRKQQISKGKPSVKKDKPVNKQLVVLLRDNEINIGDINYNYEL